eukprot:maker-scaffold_13-snap-gene-5.2-mRNA-1 protein AED:0.08 eAED:0.09 QI:0/1/0.75/1/1/1/4/94/801
MTNHRLCIVNDNSPGIMSQISFIFLSHNINITQQFTRTYGRRLFCVFDVDVNTSTKKDENKLIIPMVATLVKEIEALEGVFSCELNHFTYGVDKENSERLCIVNKNKAGVIQEISKVVSKHGLDIVSQVSKSSGRYGYTIIDVSEGFSRVSLSQIVDEILESKNIITCNIGNFAPGTLHKLELLEKGVKPTRRRSSGGDSGYESEHEDYASSDDGEIEPIDDESIGNLSITSNLIRHDKKKLTNMLQRSLSYNAYSDINKPLQKTKSANKDLFRENFLLEETLQKAQCPGYYEGSNKMQQNPKTWAMEERASYTSLKNPKLLIALVGLPAVGKSFSSRKLEQFFNWKCMPCKIFNAGKYRRETSDQTGVDSNRADFFNANNKEGEKARTEAAIRCLKDLLIFLVDGGEIGIFDATNTTRIRRETIANICRNICNVVFLEVICDDESMLEENYKIKVQNSPDFVGMDMTEALADLKSRVDNYKKVYEPVDESELDGRVSFLKLYNMSSKIVAKGIYGRMTRSVLPYLSSLHLGSRRIILVRAGLGNMLKKGKKHTLRDKDCVPSGAHEDSTLSDSGKGFARRLGLFLKTIIFMNKEVNQMVGVEAAPSNAKTQSNPLPEVLSFDDPTSHAKPRIDDLDEMRQQNDNNRTAEVKIFSSTLNRALETARIASDQSQLTNDIQGLPMLNPVNKGRFGNLSHDELARKEPEFWREYQENPFYARFPGGESYFDIVTKLESLIIQVEQQTSPVLIIGHISTLQTLMAYFRKTPVDHSVNISIPLHTAIELQPLAGGLWREKRYKFTV